ncbi:MAG: RNA-binding S4 domain-containing protein [Sporomusaceae bacterium]|nr:RNA-binding S4 domain-containing protein [Sporomusaceae bacterium]
MESIEINTDTIQLDQFLKWAGIVESGGQVKLLLADEMIYLNDQLVTEKRKKLKAGDIITIEGVGTYQIVTG